MAHKVDMYTPPFLDAKAVYGDGVDDEKLKLAIETYVKSHSQIIRSRNVDDLYNAALQLLVNYVEIVSDIDGDPEKDASVKDMREALKRF